MLLGHALSYNRLSASGGAPSLSLNFAGATSLDPKITFTRASTATYTNSAGLIASAATNAPRFDYDPVTLQPKGLLIEEQRTNLLTYSEQFDNAAWGKIETSVSANVFVAPDGTTTADKFVPSVNALSHYIQNTVTSTTAQFTGSLYVKLDGSAVNKVTLYPGGAATFANFDMSIPTVSWEANVVSASITSIGNGWYRLTATWASSVAVDRLRIYASSGTIGAATTAGDGTSGVYIWGAQLEAGAFATSYIPTVAAQVTRAADNAVMTGTNFSSWYNQTAGSFFASASGRVGVGGSAVMFAAASNAASGFNTSPQLDFLPAPSIRSFYTNAVGGTVAQPTTSIATLNATYNVATAMDVSGVSQVINGGTAATSAIASLPAPTSLTIGSVSTQYLNGHIRSITYWPRRLSNTELQGVTA